MLRPTTLYTDYSDIPLYNWEKIVEEGNMKFLIVKENQRNYHVNPIRLTSAYDSILDQYFSDLGISLMSDELYALMQHRIEARDRYINGDKSALNFIRIYDSQINDLRSEETKADLVKQRMFVQKWFRQPIDAKSITLKEFCKLINLMREETERNMKKPVENGDSQED